MSKRRRGLSLTDLPAGVLQELVEYDPCAFAPLCRRLSDLALRAHRTLIISRGFRKGVRPEQLQRTLFKYVVLSVFMYALDV